MKIPKHIENYMSRYGEINRRFVVSGLRAQIDQIVIIPALAEMMTMFDTLASLSQNPPEDMNRTLIVCVINNREEGIAHPDDIEKNQQTIARLDQLIHRNQKETGHAEPERSLQDQIIRNACSNLAYVDASSPGMEMPAREGGVGMARKLGMDMALRQFNYEKPGVKLLLNLDADTRVESNYLAAVRRFFEDRRMKSAVVNYVHQMDGDPAVQTAICCYEIFLRYYTLGLRFSKSPYAYHSIGSTMVCTVDSYIAVRGMNRREAGEDFYFLNKLAKLGDVGQIHATTVYPSARPSRRVPFGTGQRVIRFLEKRQNEYLLYHPEIFTILKKWLEMISDGSDWEAKSILNRAAVIHPLLVSFLERNHFHEVWPRIMRNHRNTNALLKQFHVWFDSFKTLKLVHHLTENGFPLVDMFKALKDLLRMIDHPYPAEIKEKITPSIAEQLEILSFIRQQCRSPVLP